MSLQISALFSLSQSWGLQFHSAAESTKVFRPVHWDSIPNGFKILVFRFCSRVCWNFLHISGSFNWWTFSYFCNASLFIRCPGLCLSLIHTCEMTRWWSVQQSSAAVIALVILTLICLILEQWCSQSRMHPGWLVSRPQTLTTHFSHNSRTASYDPRFLQRKYQLDKRLPDFQTDMPHDYIQPFLFHELKSALTHSKGKSPGLSGIPYILIKHLNDTELQNLLRFYDYMWESQDFPHS